MVCAVLAQHYLRAGQQEKRAPGPRAAA